MENIFFNYNKSQSPDFQLENISLKIAEQEFISIMGPNGSGKSTLLKILCNLLTPGKGKRFFLGKPYSQYSRKDFAKFAAFVPQSTVSIFPFSVFEIVMMGRTPHLNFWGYEKSQDVELVNETLELLGIFNLRNKGINEVSGGEAQRAFLARAIVQQPKILFLDEPNAHLDIEHQISTFNFLKKLNNDHGTAIVSVSHDFNLSGYFSDRVILMRKGEIFIDDITPSVLNEENIKDIFNINSSVDYNSGRIKIDIIPGD
ncbi:MAG: ABC transporter ATP-binding protein [Ignavibacteria bacterium]